MTEKQIKAIKIWKINAILDFMDERHSDNTSMKLLDKILDTINIDSEAIEAHYKRTIK